MNIEPTVYPLYTVGNSERPSASTIGEAVADVAIDGVLATTHKVLIVPDQSIPVDVLIGRTWLELPHINYYKSGTELVIESMGPLDTKLLSHDKIIDKADLLLVEREIPTIEPITVDEVKIEAEVPNEHRVHLMKLINEYRDVFAKNIGELSCTNVLQMNIIETAGSQPVTIKPYRTSQKDRQTIADILSQWKHHGIISESTSPYASPVLLVNKSSGEKRLCVDYRKLNRQTVADPFPMPDIDSQLSTLADGNIFTTLDLSNGFLQIPLSPEAKEKTAFVTEDTMAKFERMPFGLKGAPGTFQQLMSILFKDLRKSGRVSTYLDDIIISSLNWDDMLLSLRQVFEILRNSKLTLQPAKCVFGASQLDYLGFQISKGVIRPGKKVDAIHLFPRLRDAHEMRRFLGLAGYFRRFIVNITPRYHHL